MCEANLRYIITPQTIRSGQWIFLPDSVVGYKAELTKFATENR